MKELHEKEQYFFADSTVKNIINISKNFNNICVICAPAVGQALSKLNINVTILDIDDRFNHISEFMYYDILKPKFLNQRFDLIICDPPFFNVKLSELRKCIEVLSNYDFSQKLLISYLSRREKQFLNTFSKFNLTNSGIKAEYKTVEKCKKNDIVFFSNFIFKPKEYFTQ